MQNITDALLAQREKLIKELCDLNFNESSVSQKVISLNEQIDKIDTQVLKVLENITK